MFVKFSRVMASFQNPSISPFPRLSIARIEGKARSVRYQQTQFRQLHESLTRGKDLLVHALRDDFGFSESEALLEYSLALLDLRYHYDSLDLEKELAALRAIENKKVNACRSVSTGYVYIAPQMGVFSVVSPLCAALAAGNCIIIELPQTTMRTTSALRDILLDALDHDIFAISKELPDGNFMRECTVVARTSFQSNMVFQKLIHSPENSKNFVFVDRTADLKLAAQCMLAGRFGFNGTSSYSPDAVFIHEAVLTLLLNHLIPAASDAPCRLNGNPKAAVPPIGSAEGRSKEKPSLEALTELNGATLLFSSTKGAIIQTDDSTFPTLLQSQLVIESSVPLLLLCSVTSMDTAIDLATQYGHQRSGANMTLAHPSAAFIFASPVDAQYLSNSVGADLTCINTFPAQLMVGPKLPRSVSFTGNDCDLTPRYGRHLFEEHQAVFSRQSPAFGLLGDATVGPEGKERRARIVDWTTEMLMPLTPTGQPEGMRDDIFGVGIMISASMVGIPLAIGLAFLGRFAFRQLSSVNFIHR